MSRPAASLTDKQFALARAFERATLCSISQAVKAFERHNDEQIEEWKRQLRAKSDRVKTITDDLNFQAGQKDNQT